MSKTQPETTIELDAVGLLCPLPVLKARKRLRDMAKGQILRLIATDPAAVIDVPHYCREAGHEFMGNHPAPADYPTEARAYLIRRG